MSAIASNIKNNKKDFIAIVCIQLITAIGCYLLIPSMLN